jgi:hypothetical protein
MLWNQKDFEKQENWFTVTSAFYEPFCYLVRLSNWTGNGQY